MSVPYPTLDDEKKNLYPTLPEIPPENPQQNPPPVTETFNRSEAEEELRTIEGEIATLKAVLASKQERAAHLKRQLGIFGFDVAKDDVKRAAQSIAHSKTYTTVKGAVAKQWNSVTQTNAYKTVNTGVSSFFKSVKTSLSGASTPQQPSTSTNPAGGVRGSASEKGGAEEETVEFAKPL